MNISHLKKSDSFYFLRKILSLKIGFLLLFLSVQTFHRGNLAFAGRRCTGSAGCTACTNCNGCKYCNEGGGTCGVCSYVPDNEVNSPRIKEPENYTTPTNESTVSNDPEHIEDLTQNEFETRDSKSGESYWYLWAIGIGVLLLWILKYFK